MKYWLVDLDVKHYRSFTWPRTPERKQRWYYWMDRFQEGGRFAGEWEPPYLQLFQGEVGQEEEETRKPIPDFINGYIDLACSQRAKEVVEPLVGNQIEFLPLRTEIGLYWELNIPRLPCLDVERAKIEWVTEGEVIFRVIRYACRWTVINGHHLFYVSEDWPASRFASEAFRRLVEAHGLTGLVFREIPLVEGERPPWED
ncbi:MAG: hypothetical protein GXO36_02855 [Chloroflexi bacterium]|nr:hypothetical protein [Chloroflexota bacterium]